LAALIDFFPREIALFSRSDEIRAHSSFTRSRAAAAAAAALPREKHDPFSRRSYYSRRREKKFNERTNVPVYCSTSDFTHPFNPSSKVSKNAAPSNFVAVVDEEEANATVVAATQMCFSPIFYKSVYINTLSLSILYAREQELMANEVTFDRGQTKLVSKCFFLCLGFRV